MSSMAARAMTVPRMGWEEKRMNSLLGSKLWLTLWPRVALYLGVGGGCDRKYGKTKELHISCTTSAPVKVPPLVLSLTLMYFHPE